jgi:hypothetical protein
LLPPPAGALLRRARRRGDAFTNARCLRSLYTKLRVSPSMSPCVCPAKPRPPPPPRSPPQVNPSVFGHFVGWPVPAHGCMSLIESRHVKAG